MSVHLEYDETKAMKESLIEVHAGWNDLRAQVTRGEKAWLTQIKNHYLRLVAMDAEGAAEMLAVHEYSSHRNSRRSRKSRNQLFLSDAITVKQRREP